VRVRELSELTVTAELKGTAFSKSVNLEQGVVGFNVQKQRTDEEFRFTSPTSVASIRGTGGRLSSIDSTDTLTVIDGTVRLTNSVSSLYADVGAGFTGISNPDGTVRVRPSTLQERRAAESASRPADQDNMLEFDLRDAQGNKKQLRIEFKD
jgi:hypothetical protein